MRRSLYVKKARRERERQHRARPGRAAAVFPINPMGGRGTIVSYGFTSAQRAACKRRGCCLGCLEHFECDLTFRGKNTLFPRGLDRTALYRRLAFYLFNGNMLYGFREQALARPASAMRRRSGEHPQQPGPKRGRHGSAASSSACVSSDTAGELSGSSPH